MARKVARVAGTSHGAAEFPEYLCCEAYERSRRYAHTCTAASCGSPKPLPRRSRCKRQPCVRVYRQPPTENDFDCHVGNDANGHLVAIQQDPLRVREYREVGAETTFTEREFRVGYDLPSFRGPINSLSENSSSASTSLCLAVVLAASMISPSNSSQRCPSSSGNASNCAAVIIDWVAMSGSYLIPESRIPEAFGGCLRHSRILGF